MEDDEEDSPECIAVYQFINYANKVIWHGVRDFDLECRKRHSHEILSDEGDIQDVPAMNKWLIQEAEQDISLFWRSDGMGDPMLIRRQDLALAIEELAPAQRDAIIKIFHEEMPVASYAKEQGITRAMAYRRMGNILDKLWEAMIGRMTEHVYKNMQEKEKISRASTRKAEFRVARHYRSTKR